MSTIRGTIRDGKVVLDAPPGWPEGAHVRVELVPVCEQFGLSEDEQGDDPDSVTRWLAWCDALEPLVLAPGDEERIQQARAEQQAFELAEWERHSEKLEKLFK